MPKKQKTKYTAKELKEFEKLILDKIKDAQGELDFIKESLLRKNLSGTDSTQGALKTLEDGADTMEKESLSQLAGRQQKFIHNLEKALIRIKNGTYGICKDTGVLIDKKLFILENLDEELSSIINVLCAAVDFDNSLSLKLFFL